MLKSFERQLLDQTLGAIKERLIEDRFEEDPIQTFGSGNGEKPKDNGEAIPKGLELPESRGIYKFQGPTFMYSEGLRNYQSVEVNLDKVITNDHGELVGCFYLIPGRGLILPRMYFPGKEPPRVGLVVPDFPDEESLQVIERRFWIMDKYKEMVRMPAKFGLAYEVFATGITQLVTLCWKEIGRHQTQLYHEKVRGKYGSIEDFLEKARADEKRIMADASEASVKKFGRDIFQNQSYQ